VIEGASVGIKDEAALLELQFGGDWLVNDANEMEGRLFEAMEISPKPTIVDLSRVSSVDTIGAWLIYRTVRDLEIKGHKVHVRGLSDELEGLLQRIKENDKPCASAPPYRNVMITKLEGAGFVVTNLFIEYSRFFSFVGSVVKRLAGAVFDPKRIKVTALVNQFEYVGLNAIWVVMGLAAIFGAVIVSQGALQLRQFGAEIMVVDMLAITHLREMGVFLTAIVVAGRTGSAFTAEIGSMKLHEEIDAMETIGLNPLDTLVLPRFLALMLALPCLTMLADFAGIMGGMLVAVLDLGISPDMFFIRLQEAAGVEGFVVGLIKSFFFAAVISLMGCFEGMSVSGSAESVGQRTTSSVVQSIVLMIILDGFFAFYFSWLDF